VAVSRWPERRAFQTENDGRDPANRQRFLRRLERPAFHALREARTTHTSSGTSTSATWGGCWRSSWA